jgi:ParB family chromosome partitioning protein
VSVDKRKALGRGLDALLPQRPGAPPLTASHPTVAARRDYFLCAIEDVHPSGQNPRRSFDEPALVELADSIREHGVIQPLVVRARSAGEGGGFTLVAGERRWRAAQKAGLKEVPVVVKDATSTEAFEMALVENLQRRDLNPIEEAEAFRQLTEHHGYTAEHLAKRIGKDRTTIANTLRLLKLPTAAKVMVADGRLQMGHARALLGLEKEQAIVDAAEQVVKGGLSARQTEALVKKLREPRPVRPARDPQKSANVRDLEKRLERAVGLPVRVVERAPNAGRLEIDYANLDELERVLDKLLRH